MSRLTVPFNLHFLPFAHTGHPLAIHLDSSRKNLTFVHYQPKPRPVRVLYVSSDLFLAAAIRMLTKLINFFDPSVIRDAATINPK
jgi:hypothetical protein